MSDGENRRLLVCDACLKREGQPSGLERVKSQDCFVCGGLISRLDVAAKRVLRALGRYEFHTFSIGLILPSGMQEREDQLRSQLRIKGRETIKAQLGREISKIVSNSTRREVNKLRPDATVLIDMSDLAVHVSAKPLFIHGRYSKPRGVQQRRTFCETCNGRGCGACLGTGYTQAPSVESVVAKRLGSIMGSEKMRFTWLGSEDTDSLVFAPGRPFVVELKSPKKRRAPKHLDLSTGVGRVKISGLSVLDGRPVKLPGFVFETRATLTSSKPVKKADLKRLTKAMRNTFVRFQTSKGSLVNKKVYAISAKATGKMRLVADIKIDGGLPVKRLVDGDSVSPSLSEILRMNLNCQRFDIIRVREIGDFQFEGTQRS